MSVQRAGLFLIIAICAIKAGDAIKCYECNSMQNSACDDSKKVEQMQMMDCARAPKPMFNIGAKNATGCLKMIKQDRGQKYTVRGCFFENPLTPGMNCVIDISTPTAVYESCEVCNKDYCNGSSTYYASLVLIVSTAILALKN